MTIGDEKVVATVCLITDMRLPHFANAEIQLFNGHVPTIGDRFVLHSAYAQQPAAVDEAMVERVAISIYAAARGFSAEVAREKWPSVEQKSRFTGPARAALGQEATND